MRNVKVSAKQIQLPDGSKVMVHDEAAYDNFFDKGQSFEVLEGEGEDIEFVYDFATHREGINEMTSVGNSIYANPMAVYHNNMLWCYTYRLSVEDKTDDEYQCLFEVIPLGPAFSQKPDMITGGLGNNHPKGQKAPKVLDARLEIVTKDGPIDIDLDRIRGKPSLGDGFRARRLVSRSEMLSILGDEDVMRWKLSIIIEKKYFDLTTFYKDHEIDEEPPLPVAQKVLKTILKGDKPPQHDWVITVGDGSPREFFVHRKVLADTSHIFEIVFRTHMSLSTDQLLMVSHEDRFILPKAHAEDMKVLLSYAYLRRPALPDHMSFARLGKLLMFVFTIDVLREKFFPVWEREMVKKVFAMDKKDCVATLKECTLQLIDIFSAPYGALPIAKRVTQAAMADTWNMASVAGIDVEDELRKMSSVCKTDHFEKVLHSVQKFKTVVGGVQKRII